MSCLGARSFYLRADKAATEEAMDRVGALALRSKSFGSLSSGQQQRVLLARALAPRPPLLVLDEPTTGLDPEAASSFYRTVGELAAGGTGILAVTHDVDVALPRATHILKLRAGCARSLAASEYRGGEGQWA